MGWNRAPHWGQQMFFLGVAIQFWRSVRILQLQRFTQPARMSRCLVKTINTQPIICRTYIRTYTSQYMIYLFIYIYICSLYIYILYKQYILYCLLPSYIHLWLAFVKHLRFREANLRDRSLQWGCQGNVGERRWRWMVQDGASKIALSWYIYISGWILWFMVDTTIVNIVYKPTYNWGAPSCRVIAGFFLAIESNENIFRGV